MANGLCVLLGILCCHCGARGTLVFTGRWVARGVVERDARGGTKFRHMEVPLAECTACGRSARVLPSGVLPYKTFTLPVIEEAAKRYVSCDGPGLRGVVAGLGKHAPDHSTLHRWSAGLGERVLDRLPRGAVSAPRAAALVGETERQLGVDVRPLWRCRHRIAPWKHQTERRRDELEACARVLAVAVVLFPSEVSPLTEWDRRLVEFLGVAAWTFWTGRAGTAMQHPGGVGRGVGCARRLKPSAGGCRHAPRSPPGGGVSPGTDIRAP